MKTFHVTVLFQGGGTTEIVLAKNEESAKRKAIAQYNKRNKLVPASGAYVSNKGVYHAI